MRVHHLDCCTMCPRGRSAWNGEGSFFARATLVSHCLLIETEAHGLVLVDTGIGVGDVRNSRRLGPMFGRAMAIRRDQGGDACAEACRVRPQAVERRDFHVAGAGLRVLTDPALWGAHHDLTGPVAMSWPEALEVLSAELGERVTFQVASERQLLERLSARGVPAGEAELLIAREWAILAGENDYTTDTFQQITGRPPRPLAEFIHDYRAEFV